jgi:hypothetical protein
VIVLGVTAITRDQYHASKGVSMSEDVPSKSVKTTHFLRGVGIEAVLLLVIFLLGFVPMWLKSREAASRLSEAERHLNLARIQNAMASAAVDTR